MTWSVAGVTVHFGNRVALSGVDLTIEPGQVHAVIGGDGAGKSTLLRVLAGLDLGQAGVIHLPPEDRIGYVPSEGGVFGDLTVNENMDFIADAYRLDGWRDRGEALLERAALGPFGDRLGRQLSGGQRRKLAGSLALLAQPDLLVLDEVTTGVDPVSRMELWRLIAAAAASGAAVVASTTYLEEAERAETVMLLHEGQRLVSGTPQTIVDGIPGAVFDRAAPDDPDRAWRRGARWRQWDPAADPATGISPTLEDAAIVRELLAGASP
jgi:ABC-2 type transport system ATP-binding protein